MNYKYNCDDCNWESPYVLPAKFHHHNTGHDVRNTRTDSVFTAIGGDR